MANFDRSKFKAAKVADLKEQKQEAEALMPQSNSTRPEYISLEKGENIIRIFPPHPGGKSYVQQKCVHWLPFIVDEKDDKGKVTGQKDTKRPIFNARIHAGSSKDVIEEYIAAARRLVEEDKKLTAEEIKKKIDLLYNFKRGEKVSGNYSWVIYGKVTNSKGTKFGRIELKTSIKNRLDDISTSENASDPMKIDPFTDPDSGFAIKVTYNPDADKAQDYYKTEFLTKDYVPVVVKLTDEELEHFSKMDSLHDMLVNSYKAKNFEKAIEGLELYDKKNGFGVFDKDIDFLDTCAQLADQYPEEEEKKDDEPEVQQEPTQEKKQDTFIAEIEEEKRQEEQQQQAEEVAQEATVNYPSNSMSDDDKKAKLAALKAKLGKK